jgi:hypothetical protein
MKTCSICKKEKELTEFYKHNRMKDGYFSTCKTCISLKKNKKRNENYYLKKTLGHYYNYLNSAIGWR